MTVLRIGALGMGIALAGFAACTQSYDDFDFSGQPGVGGSAGSQTTTAGTATGGGGSGAQGGSGAAAGTGGTGGTGGQGATGGAGGAGAQGGSGGGGVIVSCQQQYAHADIADYCNETATECDLGANTRNGDHCDDICAAGGGECLGAYNDTFTGSCVRSGQGNCATSEYSSGICVCSRGCGSGPPCQAPQMCNSGNCG